MLHAAPQTRTTCPSLGSLSLSLSLIPHFPLSAPSSCCRLSPTLHHGKKETWELKDSKAHVVSHKTLHALCVAPPPPPPTHTLSHILQPLSNRHTHTHSDLQGGEKSYMWRRGNNGKRGSNIGQQSELSVVGKHKDVFWGVGGGTMATVRKKVTAGSHSCTGPRTMPILWLAGAALCTR